MGPWSWLESPEVPVVSCIAVCPSVDVFHSAVVSSQESAAIPTAADVSSVTNASNVSGVQVIQESLLLLAALMLLAPCHFVDTHAVDGICCSNAPAVKCF